MVPQIEKELPSDMLQIRCNTPGFHLVDLEKKKRHSIDGVCENGGPMKLLFSKFDRAKNLLWVVLLLVKEIDLLGILELATLLSLSRCSTDFSRISARSTLPLPTD